MAKRNFFSHTNPDGLEPQDRITAAGCQWSACTENILMMGTAVNTVLAMDGLIHPAIVRTC